MKKILLLLFFASSQAWSFLSINESAEILPENYFNLGFAPQAFLSNGPTNKTGYDISVFADTHLMENTDVRLTLGAGTVDFWTQASLKWVPFPDVDNQPAMGLRTAVAYVRSQDSNNTTTHFGQIQIAPLISKKSNTAKHDMIPYFSIPITYSFEKNNSSTSYQAALGAIWFPWPSAQIGAEFDLSLKNSTSSASVFLNFPFEASTGYKKY